MPAISTPDLTTKQTLILSFIKDRVEREGRPPTLREIGSRFGFRSTGTTRDHLKALAKKGWIKLCAKRARSIRLVASKFLQLPILGSITAGLPDLALEETEEYLRLDDWLSTTDNPTFALKIQGESLIEKGINDGDIAIIKRQKTAQVGDIVAARFDHEATIKILKKDSRGFYLAAANKAFEDIRKPFEILGRTVAVIKKF